MSGNSAIDVAIGLILLYLVLSIICTTVNEFVATLFKFRAKTLASGIASLLDNPQLRADFYNHGLIDSALPSKTKRLPSYLAPDTFARALLASLDVTKPIPGFADIQQAVMTLPDCNIRDALLAHLGTANGDVNRLRTEVAAWFDTAMDRLGGIYKRKAKGVAFVVGLFLAAGLNADSIRIAERLWMDPALRQAASQSAQDFEKYQTYQPPSVATTSTQPVDAAKTGSSAAKPSCHPGDSKDAYQSISGCQDILRPIPLGWDPSTLPGKEDYRNWLKLCAGLLLTAVALSLGAPFWFDLLGKFMNLRGAGPRPERTQTANS
jgi:hypothetical protein